MEKQKFMGNFNPNTSERARRKAMQKANAEKKQSNSNSALFDEKGIHIATGLDLCDCLTENCPGCFNPCLKCKSTKCGPECRISRKYVVEEVDFEGCNITYKNPHI